MKHTLPKLTPKKIIILSSVLSLSFFIVFLVLLTTMFQKTQTVEKQKAATEKKLQTVAKELQTVKNEDQYVINKKNTEEIKQIHTTYQNATQTFEKLNDFKNLAKNTAKQDELFARALKELAEKNYASAEATLAELTKQIDSETSKLTAAAAPVVENAPVNNTPPGNGFQRQTVQTEIGTFTVSLIAADLGSTRVIVDTASDGDCRNDCPVLSLGDYVARNGAYAGINGSYFCPASYPSCAGKTNSFDLLVMNKNKKYINADNNVYSTNPAVIFSSGSVRFVARALEWGRDTGVDGVISNFPLLVSGNNVVFNGDGDPKKGSKGSRSFVANKGNIVYIGVVYNATVAEGGYVLKTLGMDNAMNLDSGGSTALWFNGYKAGPGRNIPNAILFVRK